MTFYIVTDGRMTALAPHREDIGAAVEDIVRNAPDRERTTLTVTREGERWTTPRASGDI